MNKKIIYIAMQIPLLAIMIGSFVGSIYAAVMKISGIDYVAPIIFGVVIGLYFYGRYLEHKLTKKPIK